MKKHNHGFSLVEIAVALVIIGLLLGGLITLFSVPIKSYTTQIVDSGIPKQSLGTRSLGTRNLMKNQPQWGQSDQTCQMRFIQIVRNLLNVL